MGQLFLWSSARSQWAACPPDEITWLDRGILSGNKDLTLHRAPRCAGLRYVHHRWELFSRDTSFPVYLAPEAGVQPRAEAVQRAARHVLPVAPARYEAQALVLEEGPWLLSIGGWVLGLRLERAQDAPPAAGSDQPPTQTGSAAPARARQGSPPRPEAQERVRRYFERNATARMAMAFYYQEYILGLAAPQAVPMMDVVIGLNLSGEGAVSDLKKLLQGFIWKERGHARDLADFLLSQGLLTPADLDQAREAVADNERRGVCAAARKRLRYKPRAQPGKQPSQQPGQQPSQQPGPPPT
jgi:hypothetical protein